MKTRTIILLVALPLSLLLICASVPLGLAAWSVSASTTSTTDVAQYQALRNQWMPTGLVQHFPITIPPGADHVRLFHRPKFLQGSGHLQIRFRLPSADIAHVAAQARRAATHEYKGGSRWSYYNIDPPNNLPLPSLHTADDPTSTHQIPPHYTIYVLTGRVSSSANHGATSGIVISVEDDEVLYWAEEW